LNIGIGLAFVDLGWFAYRIFLFIGSGLFDLVAFIFVTAILLEGFRINAITLTCYNVKL